MLGFSGVHAAYIIRNETTIEHLGDRDNDIRVDFDMSGQNFEVVSMPVFEYLWERSKMENWKQVMGNNPLGWFCKYFVRGDPRKNIDLLYSSHQAWCRRWLRFSIQ